MSFNAKLLVALTIALACVASDTTGSERQSARETQLAQASPSTATDSLQGVGLTASHKQIIFDHIAGEDTQTFSNDSAVAVGSTIPDALILNTMPIAVKEQIGRLKDFKFVKLAGDKILIVDPASRKIIEIVTKEEAAK